MRLTKEKTTTTVIERNADGSVVKETTTVVEKEYTYEKTPIRFDPATKPLTTGVWCGPNNGKTISFEGSTNSVLTDTATGYSVGEKPPTAPPPKPKYPNLREG